MSKEGITITKATFCSRRSRSLRMDTYREAGLCHLTESGKTDIFNSGPYEIR